MMIRSYLRLMLPVTTPVYPQLMPTKTPAVRDLPAYPAMAEPKFSWGTLDSGSFAQSLDDTYAEVVHWKKNCFKIPLGYAGKSFAMHLFTAFTTGSALESVALKAAIVLPLLVLQHSSIPGLKITSPAQSDV